MKRSIKNVKRLDPILMQDRYEFTVDIDRREYKFELFDYEIKEWMHRCLTIKKRN